MESRFAAGEMCCRIFFSWELFATEKQKFDEKVDGLKREPEGRAFKKIAADNLKRYEKFFDLHFVQTDDGRIVLTRFEKKRGKENLACKYFGCFVIIASETMSAEDAYCLYRSGDEIEKPLLAEKSFAPCERAESSCSLRGKRLVEFGALILYSRMMKSLRKAGGENVSRPNCFNVRGAVAELEEDIDEHQARQTLQTGLCPHQGAEGNFGRVRLGRELRPQAGRRHLASLRRTEM